MSSPANYSFSRNGLVTIQFTSNVRDIASDIRRQQDIRDREDPGEMYQVFNSDINFDVNKEMNADELFENLTIPSIKSILNTFRIPFPSSALKIQLVQLLNTAVRTQPTRLSYVRQIYSQQVANLRRNRQVGDRPVNSSLLVSNHYRYKKSDFKDMSYKDILRSLFDINSHLIFLYERVLKGEKIPESRANIITNVNEKVNKHHLKNPLLTYDSRKEVKQKIFREESLNSDRILKNNSDLVMSVLFATRRPFYIDKKQYTILGYHIENDSNPDPQIGLVLPQNSIYVINPIKLHLELSDLPPDQVSEKQVQKVGCHLRYEKIRKDWHDIWNRPDRDTSPQKTFHRKFHKTLRRRDMTTYGGRACKSNACKSNACKSNACKTRKVY